MSFLTPRVTVSLHAYGHAGATFPVCRPASVGGSLFARRDEFRIQRPGLQQGLQDVRGELCSHDFALLRSSRMCSDRLIFARYVGQLVDIDVAPRKVNASGHGVWHEVYESWFDNLCSGVWVETYEL